MITTLVLALLVIITAFIIFAINFGAPLFKGFMIFLSIILLVILFLTLIFVLLFVVLIA